MNQQILSVIFPDGNPNGVRKIEIPHSSVKAYVVPRGSLASLNAEQLLRSPGMYFLFGDGDTESRPKVYIGESESVLNRLMNHNSNKDFWNTAYVFVGDDLHRSTVKYLEHKAILKAKEIDRNEIMNDVEPLENRLPDVEKIASDQYLEKIEFIVSFLGLTLFQPILSKTAVQKQYYFKTDKAEGRGTLLESGEFVVYEGSLARVRETPAFTAHKHAPALRQQLLASGILNTQDKDSYVFTKDFVFSSPSAAGNAVAGRSTNGWDAWVDDNGKTLDENVRK